MAKKEGRLTQAYGKAEKVVAKGISWWGSCNPENVLALASEVAEMGGAVLLSKTSDGGALKLMVMLDDERKSWYFNADSNIDDEVSMIRGVLTNG